jgi:hypothetical protein
MAMKRRLAKALSASSEYVRRHDWLWRTFGILGCAALSISHASSQGYVWDHTSIVLLLPLPVLLVVWLVDGAQEARERLGQGQSCRRQ